MLARKPLYVFVATALIGATPVLQAQAQEDAPARRASAASSLLEEVLVTARKRGAAEEAQTVPVTISALNGDQLDAMFAQSLADVSMTMPNVRLDADGAFPGVSNFSIRGMGFISTIASNDPTVGLFQDGMYIGANLGGSPDTFDLESVEVLRGPQGTLFGRNVTAGAVIMNSRRPNGDFGGVLRAGVGSGDRVLMAAGVEGGITDTLSGKIYAQYNDMNGDFDNLVTGDDYGAHEIQFVRPILRWQPSDALDISLITEYSKHRGDGTATRFIEYPGQLLFESFGNREPKNADQVTMSYDGLTDIEVSSAVLDISWQVGEGTVTSITGYRDVSYYSQGDTDSVGSAVTTDAWLAMEQDQFSQELRYSARAFNDKLDYTIGLYYFEQSMEQQYNVLFFGDPALRSDGALDQESASVFLQADYEFIDNWFLTLGGRYTWETKEAKNASFSDCVNLPPDGHSISCDLSDSGDEDWSNFSPKVGVNWQVTDDVMFYASYTQGFRSGGYNIRTTSDNESPGPYDEEKVDAYEIGMKSDLWDGKARVNAAIFHNEYDDLQRTRSIGIENRIDNVAAATTEGAELELMILPIENLAISASVGYLDAQYDDFPTLDVDFDGVPDPDKAKGLQLVKAPEWSYNVTGIYDIPLGDAGDISTRVSYTYNDETPINDQNTLMIDEWELWDASLTWRPVDLDLEVSVWGKNLTDEVYAESGTYVHTLWTNLYQALPRRYGIEMVYRF
ncbi:TonB-dependent receptor [Haliea sp. E17]|uniref:TonB-dependent receptor n=1 Tax=Haliea sp. E17 TaxID=3401576 RepID=UPI003AACF303